MKTMNILKSLAAAAVMAAALVSCSSDDILNPTEQETSRTITVNLIPEGETTRTMLDADAKLRWQTGDEVSYFTSANGTDWSTSQKAEIDASTGSFAATIPNGATQIRVVYPAVDNGTAFAESLTDVNQKQTYGAPLPLPMRTTATEISDGAQSINAHYTVNGAVVKVTVTGVEAADIKAVCLGKYTCEVPDGEASDDGTFFVVVPIGSTVEYTPSVHATDNGSKKTYIRKEAKTSTFTSKAYELSVNVAEADKYSTMTGWFVDNGDGTGTLNGHAWVDLGLPSGTKWATCNIGADTPTAYGDYYAWGETSTKTEYTASNSATYGKTLVELKTAGYIDDNNNLVASYDAATANWGSTWRMPTSADIQELIDYCDWTWKASGNTDYNGVVGYEVTSSNGKSIFLPAAGRNNNPTSTDTYAGKYGYYMSSTAYDDGGTAYNLQLYSSNKTLVNYVRYAGCTIRPVTK